MFRLMPRVRRTQEQRSAAMRERLLEATVACLYERGYARTTTTEIVRRARVSRGAQLHHFPTKDELVITAVEHLFQKCRLEFRDAFDRLPPGSDTAPAAVDLLWGIISGPTFYAWLELIVAARTDARLRRTVHGLSRRLVEMIQRTFHDLFPGAQATVGDAAAAFAFDVLQGVALDRMVWPEAPHIPRVIDRLRALGSLVLPTTAKEKTR
jgi:AcrR family transcriptional regulator